MVTKMTFSVPFARKTGAATVTDSHYTLSNIQGHAKFDANQFGVGKENCKKPYK